MQLHLTKVYRSSKDKNGNPLKTRAGKPYERVSIKTQEYGDKWLSGFGATWNGNWQDDSVVNVEVEESGQYLNFKRIDPMIELEQRVSKLEAAVFKGGNNFMSDAPVAEGAPDDEINVEDIPF
jgi:hypothetical protein